MYIYVLHANRCSFDKGSINMCVFLTYTHTCEKEKEVIFIHFLFLGTLQGAGNTMPLHIVTYNKYGSVASGTQLFVIVYFGKAFHWQYQ